MILYYHKMEFLFDYTIDDISIKKIFTNIQISILKKRLQNLPLNSNEKTYYYKFIKPKIIAMSNFFSIENIFINGKKEIIKKRIIESINIIKRLEKKYKNRRILISGSFLFKEKFSDVDVFIFSKYTKDDYIDGKLHISFIPESSLNTLFFSSLYQISVSNFKTEYNVNYDISLDDILQTYELMVDSFLNSNFDNGKILRDFILKMEYVSKGVILNTKQLYFMKEKFFRKSFEILSNNFINSILLGFEECILLKKLKLQIRNYKKILVEYPNAKNIPIYIKTYTKVISFAKCTNKTIDKKNIRE